MPIFLIYFTSHTSGHPFRYRSSSSFDKEPEAIQYAKDAIPTHGFDRSEVFKIEGEPVPLWDSLVAAEADLGAGI